MAQDTDQAGSTVPLQLRVEETFKQKVRVEAAKQGKNMSEYIRSTLRKSWETGSKSGISEPVSDDSTSPQSGDFEDGNQTEKSDKTDSEQVQDTENTE